MFVLQFFVPKIPPEIFSLKIKENNNNTKDNTS